MDMHFASYISGYVDGEGCFCVSFQPSKRHRFGWEVRPSFSVSQNSDRAQLLYQLHSFWKCGHIRPDRSDSTLKYEVRNIGDLMEKVIPHFREYPLLSAKQEDVELFGSVCELVYAGKHLEVDGLVRILSLATKMNPTGKRKYSCSEILESLRTDEGIVYAAGNRGLT